MPGDAHAPGQGAIVVRANPNKQWNPQYRAFMLAHAWKRKVQGWSARQIAVELECSPATVRGLWREAARENPAADIETYRAVQRERYDELRRLLGGVMAQAALLEDFDLMLKTGDRIARLNEAEQRLLGLDAPSQVEVAVTVKTEQERQLDGLLARIEEESRDENS